MDIRFVLFNGSPRKWGNTELCLQRVARGLSARDVATEIDPLSEFRIAPGRACQACRGRGRCVQDDDLNAMARPRGLGPCRGG